MKPDAAVSYGADDLAEIGKVSAATPTVPRIAEELGIVTRIEPHPQTGRPEVVADLGRMDRRKLGVLKDAMAPSWRMDTERQQGMDAKRDKETLRYPNGTTRRVWTAVSESVAKATGAIPQGGHGRVVLLAQRVNGRWLQCGHRAGYMTAAGGCSLCEGD